MADLLFGMTKSAVMGTVSMVKSAIEEEKKLQKSVQRNLMLISDEFEMMQSFFNVTNEHIADDMARTWVRQVRNMSLDVEECIESIVHLDKKPLWWRRKLPSCIQAAAPAAELDDVVDRIELLKSRVEAMGPRNKRYGLINNNSSSKPVTRHQLASASAVGATALDIVTEARDTARKTQSFVDLTMLVTEETDSLRVISVWGTGGGLGMTSIIKEAYNEPEICQKFRGRAWLKLAHPFNPHEFVRSLADQFYGNSCKEYGGEIIGIDALWMMQAAQGTHLVKEFVRQLNKHRYLVVLEDLSNMAEWHAVRTYLPDSKNGSRILVSTQQLEIARLCTGQPYQVSELRKLPDNHSICVFFHEGFKRVEVGIVDGGASLFEMEYNVQLVGRNSDQDKLSDLISSAVSSDRPHVISVWGFPGLGKSALVKTVLYRQSCKQTSPFQWYGYVNLSHPFNLSDFCRRMLSCKIQQSPQYCVAILPWSLRDEDIIQECKKFLQDDRCLVVIEGLPSKEEWDLIKSLILGPKVIDTWAF